MNTKFGLVAAAAALTGLALSGCSPAPVAEPQEPPRIVATAPAAAPEPELPAITLAPVGDSITACHADAPANWTDVLQAGPVLVDCTDGWAAGGTKLAEQAAGIGATRADVLVVMGGTNDMGSPRWATPLGERLASLDLIVVKSGAPRVLILACAPRSREGALAGDPAWVNEWNAAAAALAAERGWDFIDPWSDVRSPDGAWIDPAYTFDGVHPTLAASELAASQVAAKVLAMFGRD